MKADFCTVFLVVIWIVSMSTQINAEVRYCPRNAPPQFCKIYEAGRRSIQFRVCGSVLRSYFSYACGFRKRRRRNGKKFPVMFCKFYACLSQFRTVAINFRTNKAGFVRLKKLKRPKTNQATRNTMVS